MRHRPVLAGGKLAGIVSMRDVVKLRIEKIDEMMRAIRQDAELLKQAASTPGNALPPIADSSNSALCSAARFG